jgi:MFS family permease
VEQARLSGNNDRAARVRRPLDALNFFLADVRGGLGPYLAVYLLVERRWDEASIGVVMSIATAAEIVAQTPAGALVDALPAKRVLMAAAALAVTAASLALTWLSAFWTVATSQGISARRNRTIRPRHRGHNAGCRRTAGFQPTGWSQRIVQSCRQRLCSGNSGSIGLHVGADCRVLSACRHGACEPRQCVEDTKRRHRS